MPQKPNSNLKEYLEKMKKIEKKYKQDSYKISCNLFNNILCNIQANNSDINGLELLHIKKINDLDPVTKNTGFYIILSNIDLPKNKCKFEILVDNILYKAIYRGEATDKHSRLIGHLFQQQYQGNHVNFMNVAYLDRTYNGIDVDHPPFNKFNWIVIQFKMNDTCRSTRIQMEKAFDEVFNRPIFSKENKKVK